ncbi:ABC transporter ATP-binding protein [Mycoplasma sp. P36-A1]|uniref:ABC transporter ATP-binding protein n=1 Tax=Mycoplasma sp. P36-A1 TaxID=3252900 RepID=UPI003C2C8207
MNNMLEIKNISKSFNKGTINENKVLNDLTLVLKEGDFVTVIGGNGAGKSTMLNSVAGVFEIDSGQIFINQEDISKKSMINRADLIARVFQDPTFGTAPKLTIEQNISVALQRGNKRNLTKAVKKQNEKMIKEQLATFDLGLENRLKTEVSLLSGGQRQALTLLMATIKKPKLLLLDEHTAALDPKTTANVLEITDKLVNNNKITTLMITHDMEDAIKHGNRLIMLHNGRIVVDVCDQEKQNLTVKDLIEMFNKNSGINFNQDDILLK